MSLSKHLRGTSFETHSWMLGYVFPVSDPMVLSAGSKQASGRYISACFFHPLAVLPASKQPHSTRIYQQGKSRREWLAHGLTCHTPPAFRSRQFNAGYQPWYARLNFLTIYLNLWPSLVWCSVSEFFSIGIFWIIISINLFLFNFIQFVRSSAKSLASSTATLSQNLKKMVKYYFMKRNTYICKLIFSAKPDHPYKYPLQMPVCCLNSQRPKSPRFFRLIVTESEWIHTG